MAQEEDDEELEAELERQLAALGDEQEESDQPLQLFSTSSKHALTDTGMWKYQMLQLLYFFLYMHSVSWKLE